MIPLVALIRKDIILFLHDKRALILTLLMPILLAAFFGYLTGGSGKQEASKIELGVVQQDQHLISQKILAGLKNDKSLLIKELSLEQAQEQVRKGKIAVALVLPAGFGEAAGAAFFNAHGKPDLPIYYDPSQSTMLAMVKGILTQHVMQSVSAEMFSGKSGMATLDQSIAQLESKAEQGAESAADSATASTDKQELKTFLTSLKKFQQHQQDQNAQTAQTTQNQSEAAKPAGLSMPFNTKDEALSAKTGVANGYNGYAHSFAGMTVQFILFLAIDAGISVLLSRKLGIWNRQLAAPIGMNTIIVARGLSCALIALLVSCVICAVAMLVFQVQILGSVLGLMGVAVCFSLMTASFGLLIAAFGKTPEAARGIAIFATLIMVMLGGAWMPSFFFPQWLQDLTIFIPTRWAVDGFDAMTWRGLGIHAAIAPMAALLGFTSLFGALALWRFGRDQTAR
ncbi:ABC transporter permease [Undibacterium flavidum]|uniref:ABC transporter permease n=1 Tax=Undibacterium flavidum TaxID=2762297 RepID=A0ABR6YCX8_9BURK|nr:ABC transporter permease [Undibacterium flavidum]MBC3874411.1 ABC transporter permease [Undibacterium flavidum]